MEYMNRWVNCFDDEITDYCPYFNGAKIYFKEISQIREQTENGFFVIQVDKGDFIASLYSGTLVEIT